MYVCKINLPSKRSDKALCHVLKTVVTSIKTCNSYTDVRQTVQDQEAGQCLGCLLFRFILTIHQSRLQCLWYECTEAICEAKAMQLSIPVCLGLVNADQEFTFHDVVAFWADRTAKEACLIGASITYFLLASQVELAKIVGLDKDKRIEW